MMRDEQVAGLVGAGALALILGALGFQYLQHLPPCEMCHWQRWPHIAAATLGLIGPTSNKMRSKLATGAIALAALAALAAVYQWDMLMGWQPKILIFVVASLVAAALWNKDARFLAMAVIALVALSGLIGAYQTGMQYHILPGPQGCIGRPYILGSGAPPPPVRCDVATWFLFGLAMPAYNAICSFLIAGTGVLLLRRKHAAQA